MTGMKSGAGDDPFADVGDDDTDADADAETTGRSEPADDSDDQVDPDHTHDADRGTERTQDGLTTESETTSNQTTGRESGQPQVSVDDLPYIARRNVRGESVKTGRDKNVLFELRPEIAEREEEFVVELERRLGTDVPKTDAREAALATIWERPEEVVPILEEWGLGYFEE